MTEFIPVGTRYVELPSPFAMKRGGELHGARVAYETWGELNAARDNAILIVTGLSPDAHAAANAANPEAGWQAFATYGGKEVANELNRRAWKDTLPLLAADPAQVDRARYERFAAFLRARGLVKRDVPVESYVRDVK